MFFVKLIKYLRLFNIIIGFVLAGIFINARLIKVPKLCLNLIKNVFFKVNDNKNKALENPREIVAKKLTVMLVSIVGLMGIVWSVKILKTFARLLKLLISKNNIV